MVNCRSPGQVPTLPSPWSYARERTKAGGNEKLTIFQVSCPSIPRSNTRPKSKCSSSVETHFYLIVFLTAFPFIIRDCNANYFSSQVILMRERFQKDYGWDFKCLLKYTQKSLHCKRGNALKSIFK